MASVVSPLFADFEFGLQPPIGLQPALASTRINSGLAGAVAAAGREESSWVAFDGRGLMLEEGTGVSTYGEGLARAVGQLGFKLEVLLDRAPGSDGVLPPYGKPSRGAGRLLRWLKALPPGSRSAEILPLPEGATDFQRIRRSHDIFRMAQVHFDVYGKPLRISHPSPPSVMHWTYPFPIAFDNTVNVYTIHDVIPLTNPRLTSISQSRHHKLLSTVLATADHIVTVSETSRRAIIDTFDYPEEKITNTFESVRFDRKRAEHPEYLTEYGLTPQGYFLALGTIDKRKNIGRLIRAYLASGVQSPLVLIGPRGWEAEAEMAPAEGHIIDIQAAAAGARGILPLGFLPRLAVRALLKNARSLLFPSLAEGFGLPIVEAMTLGTPVLTARGGATDEISGNATLLVDPLNVAEMAAAIVALETRPELRQLLSERGTRRGAHFSVDRYAGRLEDVYRRLLVPKNEANGRPERAVPFQWPNDPPHASLKLSG